MKRRRGSACFSKGFPEIILLPLDFFYAKLYQKTCQISRIPGNLSLLNSLGEGQLVTYLPFGTFASFLTGNILVEGQLWRASCMNVLGIFPFCRAYPARTITFLSVPSGMRMLRLQRCLVGGCRLRGDRGKHSLPSPQAEPSHW